jgi:hypothetical protein
MSNSFGFDDSVLVMPTRDRRLAQSGGRLLGQGVYGCTFEPAPRCAGGQVFSRIQGLPAVGKVTVEDPKEEVGVGRAIMALPMAKQYFALPTESCKPAFPIADEQAESCRFLDDEETKPVDLAMMVLPMAGQTLLKWSMDRPRLAANYRRLFVHLLEGMVIYQGAGYVHNDIHQDNVLVDGAGVARYIDFGLAFKVADVRTWRDANLGIRFKPKYVWQPPEVHLWRMIMNGVRVADGVAQLKEVNPEYDQMEQLLPVRKSALAALTGLANTSSSIRRKDGGAYVRAYGKRFDAWRIGLCMWMLWVDLLAWSDINKTPLWDQRDEIRRVLNGLTQFDPRDRITAAQALAELDPRSRLIA